MSFISSAINTATSIAYKGYETAKDAAREVGHFVAKEVRIVEDAISLKNTKWYSEVYQLDRTPLSSQKAQELFKNMMVAKYAYDSNETFLNTSGFSAQYGGDFSFVSLEGANPFGFDFSEKSKTTEGIAKVLKKAGFENIEVDAKGAIIDRTTGLRCVILKDTQGSGEIYVGFGGTQAGSDTQMLAHQLIADGAQFLGFLPTIYKQADAIVRVLKKVFPKTNISVCGHSLGGGLTQYATLRNQDNERIQGYSFDGAALGHAAQQKINENRLSKANDVITHVTVTGDPVSDWSFNFLGTLDKIASAIGSLVSYSVPGNFGERFFIEPSYKASLLDRHCKVPEFFLGAIAA